MKEDSPEKLVVSGAEEKQVSVGGGPDENGLFFISDVKHSEIKNLFL